MPDKEKQNRALQKKMSRAPSGFNVKVVAVWS